MSGKAGCGLGSPSACPPGVPPSGGVTWTAVVLLQVEEAGHVFLLMKKDYRISRNVRLAWVLSRLHQVIWAVPEPELVKSENELDVLSILPNGWQPDEPVQPRPYLLVPSTRVTFLARQYRFVIELDLSPSTGIVDDSTGEIIFDEVFHALSRCLVGLLRPFRIPGSDIIYQPEIFVTIQAYSSIIGLQSHQVKFSSWSDSVCEQLPGWLPVNTEENQGMG
uniref:Uncharacterized protein n=23 Tax=Aves TaxID=8782 RepID=A0A8C6JCB9_MELUD